jgi:hypothetical protein
MRARQLLAGLFVFPGRGKRVLGLLLGGDHCGVAGDGRQRKRQSECRSKYRGDGGTQAVIIGHCLILILFLCGKQGGEGVFPMDKRYAFALLGVSISFGERLFKNG